MRMRTRRMLVLLVALLFVWTVALGGCAFFDGMMGAAAPEAPALPEAPAADASDFAKLMWAEKVRQIQAAWDVKKSQWDAGQKTAKAVKGINPIGHALFTLGTIGYALFARRKKIVAEGAVGGLVTTLQTIKTSASDEDQGKMVDTLLSIVPTDSKIGKFVHTVFRRLFPVPTTPGALPGTSKPVAPDPD